MHEEMERTKKELEVAEVDKKKLREKVADTPSRSGAGRYSVSDDKNLDKFITLFIQSNRKFQNILWRCYNLSEWKDIFISLIDEFSMRKKQQFFN